MSRPSSSIPITSALDPSNSAGNPRVPSRIHRLAVDREGAEPAGERMSANQRDFDGEDTTALMERVRRGEASAFELVVERHWRGTLTYVRHLCGDPERAYEVTQDAFSRLWQKREDWTPSGSVRVWLLRTARNMVISERRRWRVRALGALKIGHEDRSPRTPLQDVEALELRAAVERAIAKLSPRRKEAFVLFHLQGLSYREISGIMGVRPQTVANYLQAALADLRVLLSPHMPPHLSADDEDDGPRKDAERVDPHS